jgi:hypothetical protein
VPEISVNENRNPLFREHKVRLTGKLAAAPPTIDFVLPHDQDQAQLGCAIAAAADARHDAGTLLDCEHVRHKSAATIFVHKTFELSAEHLNDVMLRKRIKQSGSSAQIQMLGKLSNPIPVRIASGK